MDNVTKARGHLGGIAKNHPGRADLLAQARRDLAAAKLEATIKRIVEAAPPLTTEQRDRLALLLRGVPTGAAPPGLTAPPRPAPEQTVTGFTSVKTTSVAHVQGAA